MNNAKNTSSSLVLSIVVEHTTYATSGWVEVALEAKLITTGSVAGVTDGKNWDRVMNTYKSMLEDLDSRSSSMDLLNI